jgi:hypothetical protein
MIPGLSRLRALWRNLMHRKAADAELEDELHAAFDLFVDEQVAAGVGREEARRAATLYPGRAASIKSQIVQTRRGAGVETLWHDVTFGARLLRRNPLFAFTAVLSLAIGIGALGPHVDSRTTRDAHQRRGGAAARLTRSHLHLHLRLRSPTSDLRSPISDLVI